MNTKLGESLSFSELTRNCHNFAMTILENNGIHDKDLYANCLPVQRRDLSTTLTRFETPNQLNASSDAKLFRFYGKNNRDPVIPQEDHPSSNTTTWRWNSNITIEHTLTYDVQKRYYQIAQNVKLNQTATPEQIKLQKAIHLLRDYVDGSHFWHPLRNYRELVREVLGKFNKETGTVSELLSAVRTAVTQFHHNNGDVPYTKGGLYKRLTFIDYVLNNPNYQESQIQTKLTNSSKRKQPATDIDESLLKIITSDVEECEKASTALSDAQHNFDEYPNADTLENLKIRTNLLNDANDRLYGLQQNLRHHQKKKTPLILVQTEYTLDKIIKRERELERLHNRHRFLVRKLTDVYSTIVKDTKETIASDKLQEFESEYAEWRAQVAHYHLTEFSRAVNTFKEGFEYASSIYKKTDSLSNKDAKLLEERLKHANSAFDTLEMNYKNFNKIVSSTLEGISILEQVLHDIDAELDRSSFSLWKSDKIQALKDLKDEFRKAFYNSESKATVSKVIDDWKNNQYSKDHSKTNLAVIEKFRFPFAKPSTEKTQTLFFIDELENKYKINGESQLVRQKKLAK